MGNSIINSAADLMETAATTGLNNRINSKIREVSSLLSDMNVSEEYIQGVFERLSGVQSESELHEAIAREMAKIEMTEVKHKKGKSVKEDEEEDALGKGSYDASGKGAKSADVVKTKGDAKKSLEDKKKGRTVEHLQALFSGENLTNKFKNKAAAVFEAAVNARVEEIQAELVRQSRDVFVEEVSSMRYNLETKLDDYLNYVVTEWMSDNQLAIDHGVQTEISESFMSGLRDLFENHYIEVPKGRVNVLNAMSRDVDKLTKRLNKTIKENVKLKRGVEQASCGTIFENACHGLADTEVEKFKSLARGLEYSDAGEFSRKLSTIKESYFKNKQKPLGTLYEEHVGPRQPSSDDMNPRMGAYFNAVGRMSDSIENNTLRG